MHIELKKGDIIGPMLSDTKFTWIKTKSALQSKLPKNF